MANIASVSYIPATDSDHGEEHHTPRGSRAPSPTGSVQSTTQGIKRMKVTQIVDENALDADVLTSALEGKTAILEPCSMDDIEATMDVDRMERALSKPICPSGGVSHC